MFQPGAGWQYGGALSATFGSTVTSYGAELRSGLLATQLLIDILKVVCLIQAEMPEISLLHDSITVGRQIEGKWNAVADVPIAALLRHLVVYCEHHFLVKVQTQYVAAHTGDIGIELVDALASRAAAGQPLSDLSGWLTMILQVDFRNAAAWFWILHSPIFEVGGLITTLGCLHRLPLHQQLMCYLNANVMQPRIVLVLLISLSGPATF